MTKEFVTYEQAVVLKKLGFDEPCIGYYYNNKIHFNSPGVNFVGPSGEQPLPLKQQVFRWFREKGYTTSIYSDGKDGSEWYFLIKRGTITTNDNVFDSYEEAENACIDKLIEIVKNK